MPGTVPKTDIHLPTQSTASLRVDAFGSVVPVILLRIQRLDQSKRTPGKWYKGNLEDYVGLANTGACVLVHILCELNASGHTL